MLWDQVSRIRALRFERGLSQSQLATLLGVHESSVRAWEAGTVPRKAMQRKLARILLGSATAVDELGFD